MNRIVVFPSSMSESLEFLASARRQGAKVLGASSVRSDPNAHHFDEWQFLPTVNDPSFDNAFIGLLQQFGARRVFTPNNTVHSYVSALIARSSLDVELLPLPFHLELERFRTIQRRANAAAVMVHAVAGDTHELKLFDIEAILNLCDRIFGQCGEGKLSALMAAMASCPQGDVVEIGAFAGKSAAALAYLAQRLGIGATLIVDPWRVENSVQKDAPQFVQQLAVGDYWDTVADLFIANLAPLAMGRFNLMRATSEAAAPLYAAGNVRSATFGSTEYAGQIALLHIDGNHDYSEVRKDVRLWASRLRAGAWLVLDDYCWPHGDGPRRVGDAFLHACEASILRTFVIDGALFVQVQAPIDCASLSL